MKIVKFKKDHVAGFTKGDVRELDDTLVSNLKKGKYIEDATKKELEDCKKELAAREPISLYEQNKAAANLTTTKCEECGSKTDAEGNCEGCNDDGESTETTDTKYHVLTQEDIDANEEAAEGLAVGDEVELIEVEGEEVLATDDAGKLVKKPEGNE